MEKLKVSSKGAKIIQAARDKSGRTVDSVKWLEEASQFLQPDWDAKSNEYYVLGINEGSWKRFLYRLNPIPGDLFKAYCHILGVDWEEVVEKDIESSSTAKNDNNLQDVGNTDLAQYEKIDLQAKIEEKLREKANVSPEKLFGIDEYLSRLKDYLFDRESRWFISVSGAGGIGKTSLVEKLVRQEAVDAGFMDLAWVTAKRTYYRLESRSVEIINDSQLINNKSSLNIDTLIDEIASQLNIELPIPLAARPQHLAKSLRKKPYLVVIDNLETLEDYSNLFDKLGVNSNTQKSDFRPSKIIFTSRQKIQNINVHIVEEELVGISEPATLEMIRYKGISIACIRNALDEELKPIFFATNGVPLLILLVVSIIRTSDLALDEIIESLKEETDLLDYLYEETIFSLSDNAQTILMSMTEFSASNPVSRRKLRDLSDLEDGAFQNAIDECIQSSLLNSLRSLSSESRYFIHNLLYEYLRELNEEA